MKSLLRPALKARAISSRLGSLLLLFQRTPLVQMLFPEARILGGAGLGEITTWTIATIAGLGAYDTVAGATTITQLAPSSGSTTVPATSGTALSFVFQVTGAPGTAGSWTVTGTLPNGLVHSNVKNNSTDSITGVPTQTGNFPITVKCWENSNFSGGSSTKAFTIVVAAGSSTPPSITTQPASVTINSGGTTTLTLAASGTPSPTYKWYVGNSGNTSSPIAGATSASYTTPALTGNTSYWARATNSAGTADTNTATVTVRIPPAITSQPASTTINSGGTTTLTVAASGTSPTYQWYKGASGVTTTPVSGATSASYKTPVLTANATYWVRASNAAGTANSNAATVTVRIPPTITTQPVSTSIDSGQTSTFTVAASGSSPTFQWYLGNAPDTSNPVSGATTNTFTTPPLTSSASYWVRASNAAGTANSATATATVLIPPAISTQPLSTTINSGTSATLTVAASGTPSTFQWYVGASGDSSQPIEGATSETFTTPSLTTNTSYWVRATNVKGTADSDTANVTVIFAPAIITPPQSTVIASGETATFNVVASGTSPTFQWYLGGSPDTTNPISGATSDTLITQTLTESTSFWVRAANAAGNDDSATVTATVIIPPAISTQPLSTTINSGTTATLTVAASGTPSTFQWYVGASGDTSQPVDGATSETFTTPPLTADTNYWVRATNAKGTADSDTAIVTVIFAPAIITPPQSTVIASGETATFNVVASGTSPAFQWYLGESPDTTNPVSGATTDTLITPPLTESTSYWVRAANAAGNDDSATVTATVIIPPAISTQPLSTTIGSGASVALTVAASGAPSTFQWYLGTSGDTSQPVDGATSETFNTPSLTVTTSYWVRATNAKGTADSDTAVITVISVVAPAITTPPESITINSGTTATFTVIASGTDPTFQWYQGNSPDITNPVSGATLNTFTTTALTTDTAFWVRASNAVGDADSATVTATVITPPAITSEPASLTIAKGKQATLTIASSGTTPAFQWYAGNTGDTTNPIVDATAASFTTPVLASTARYWVRASNAAGDADSRTAVITVLAPPAITGQPSSIAVKKGKSATLRVSATGSALKYQWYLGKAGVTTSPVPGAKFATFKTPAIKTPTSYWVRVTNAVGRVNSKTVLVSLLKAKAVRKARQQPAASVAASDPYTVWINSQFNAAQLADPRISNLGADPDGDGLSNGDEYTYGLQPLTSEVAPTPEVVFAGNHVSLTFIAKEAAGPGYEGLTRHYAIEEANTPDSTAWTILTGLFRHHCRGTNLQPYDHFHRPSSFLSPQDLAGTVICYTGAHEVLWKVS